MMSQIGFFLSASQTPGQSPQIVFTQGDNTVLTLFAMNGDGSPVNLTSAAFSSEIKEQNGSGVAVFPNGQHAVVDAPNGKFTLTLSQADTGLCGVGDAKDIVSAITISGSTHYFRGNGFLVVNPAVPIA